VIAAAGAYLPSSVEEIREALAQGRANAEKPRERFNPLAR